MLSYCTNYWADAPDIVVYMNCDTQLAIKINECGLTEDDELIFVIKNFNYIDSPYVFLFRARLSDADNNGEVIFKITPTESKQLKPDAFYNLAVLNNAFNPKKPTEYKKLTKNGRVLIEYGAQDLTTKTESLEAPWEIADICLKSID